MILTVQQNMAQSIIRIVPVEGKRGRAMKFAMLYSQCEVEKLRRKFEG